MIGYDPEGWELCGGFAQFLKEFVDPSFAVFVDKVMNGNRGRALAAIRANPVAFENRPGFGVVGEDVTDEVVSGKHSFSPSDQVVWKKV